MKFKHVPDDLEDTGLFLRRMSENESVYIGVYRVLYGFRVRSGFVKNKAYCQLDWCAGGNWKDVERLYSLALNILSQRKEDDSVFEDLPPCSKVKPFYLDEEFTKILTQKAGKYFELIELPIPSDLVM